MIAGIRGTLEAQGPDWLVVAVGGFSIRVSVPGSTLAGLPGLGHPIHLQTHLNLRQDGVTLFGFGSADELALFEQLITVSGVGPRLALGILSAASTDLLRQAIASEDPDNLTRLPGVGKKLAGRLILELRGKLTAGDGVATPGSSSPESDMLDALVGLGYNVADVHAALRSLPSAADVSLEERIRLALQYFARR